MNRANKFWRWRNETDPTGAEGGESPARVLELYGTIASESWWEDDVTPQMFKEELFAGDGDVVIYLNSPGGDCVAASQIYTMLMDYPHDVTIKIDGIAASAASVIAMAGTKVLMAPTSLMMIHNPATIAMGDEGDMQKAIEMLSEVKESIINAYEIKTGLSRARLAHYMDAETWMNAKKAIELGFADGMLAEEEKTPVQDEAYAFSGRTAERQLLNHICARAHVAMRRKTEAAETAAAQKETMPAPGPDTPEDTGAHEAPDAEPEKNAVPHGRSVDELMERLSLMTY